MISIHLLRQSWPGSRIMLCQTHNPQSLLQQRSNNLAQPMVKLRPFRRNKLMPASFHVRPRFVRENSLRLLEIRQRQLHIALRRLIQRLKHRMPLADKQPPSRLQQSRNNLCPARDTRNPAQSPNTSEHQIKCPRLQNTKSVVHRRFNKAQLIATTRSRERSELARLVQRFRREV